MVPEIPHNIFKGSLVDPRMRATFSPAHPLADIFRPPYPPIASQSISRGVPLAQVRAFHSLYISLGEWPRLPFTSRIEQPSSIYLLYPSLPFLS
jgi:hypothetical protein